MTFETPAQEACYKQLRELMRTGLFAGYAEEEQEVRAFMMRHGSSGVIISTEPTPRRDDEALVRIFASVVDEVPLTPGLTEFLLRENNKLPLGSFSIDDTGTIILSWKINGSPIVERDLTYAAAWILQLADDYDDLIVSRFGGKRTADHSA